MSAVQSLQQVVNAEDNNSKPKLIHLRTQTNLGEETAFPRSAVLTLCKQRNTRASHDSQWLLPLSCTWVSGPGFTADLWSEEGYFRLSNRWPQPWCDHGSALIIHRWKPRGPGNKCLSLVTGWQEIATGSGFIKPVQANRIEYLRSFLCSVDQPGMCCVITGGRGRILGRQQVRGSLLASTEGWSSLFGWSLVSALLGSSPHSHSVALFTSFQVMSSSLDEPGDSRFPCDMKRR